MFDRPQKLDVSQDELAVIKAALETQAKILHVQASAGGSGARRRLNEVKKVLTQVDELLPSQSRRCRKRGLSWFGLARTTG